MVAGVIISACRRVEGPIGGPRGIRRLVYGIVQKYGVDGNHWRDVMAGVILVAFGVLKFGVRNQVHSTGNDGVSRRHRRIIATGQIKDFLACIWARWPADFMEKLGEYARQRRRE